MKAGLYRLLLAASRRVGLWVVAVIAWFISTGFFLFRPRRLATSVRFYRAAFPERGRLFALWQAWRQFHDFAGVFVERLRLEQGRVVDFDEVGVEHLVAASGHGGGVLVMSHVGNWELAARLLVRRGLKLLLYLGARQREQIERLQKSDLQRDGAQIVMASSGEEGPPDMVAALRFLESGGIVTMAGDRSWRGGERRVTVRCLGHRVELPAIPYHLALIARVPLFVFFVVRQRGRMLITCSPPIPVEAASRAQRDAAVGRAAQDYADRLAAMVRQHPEQWYSFEPFLGPPWEEPQLPAGD